MKAFLRPCGHTLALTQSTGSTESYRDSLNNFESEHEISTALSLSKQGQIMSGPLALQQFKVESNSNTSEDVVWIKSKRAGELQTSKLLRNSSRDKQSAVVNQYRANNN